MKKLFSHYFPTPSYLAMDSFSVDISDKSIKYGELIKTSSGISLGKYGKEKIPEGILVSGKIEKEDELVNILKKIKEKNGLHFIRVSLPEEQMYLFTLSIPKTKNEDLRDIILLQIEEYIPLKAIDAVFDYDVIHDDGKNILVEVVSMASVVIESYISVFNKAGLMPLAFEIESQAIARAVVPVGETAPVMIVDFGDARTGVSIYQNGRIFLTTTLSIGGIDLTNMIAKTYSISFEEAEKKKQEYGLNATSKTEDMFSIILNGISVLRDELNKQFIYWENHNTKKDEHINHIILCGGDANLTGLAEYLESSLKIKVENANVWVNILNTKELIPEMTFEESLGYATVLGLSMGNYLNKTESIINILPDKEKKIILKEYWMRFFTIFFNLSTLVGALAIFLLFPSYFLSELQENMIEDKIEVFNKENIELIDNDTDKAISDINSKLVILNKKEGDYQFSKDILDEILSSRNSGITYSQILFRKEKEGSSLEINGVAKSRDDLRIFKTTLENNLDYSEVNLPISNFLEKSDLDFTILIKLK